MFLGAGKAWRLRSAQQGAKMNQQDEDRSAGQQHDETPGHHSHAACRGIPRPGAPPTGETAERKKGRHAKESR